jgi:hypothetical protein
LEDALASGDFSTGEFMAFCRDHGLKPDEKDERSAAAFLDSKWGVMLVTVKMPNAVDEARSVYGTLVQFAKTHGLRLVDPQQGRDIDLGSAGELPPGW